jgi:alpha-L-fucosidase 2
VFQIDGNLGAVAAVCEMLVQSHDGIELLPALPPEWPAGSVSGLRLRDGFELALEWGDGAVRRAELRSLAGSGCVIRTRAPLTVTRDGRAVTEVADDGLLRFDTEPGATYVLEPRPDGG